jgi:hypothetical protein
LVVVIVVAVLTSMPASAGASRLLREGRRGLEAQRGREGCSIPHTAPFACGACPHPDRELDAGHG